MFVTTSHGSLLKYNSTNKFNLLYNKDEDNAYLGKMLRYKNYILICGEEEIVVVDNNNSQIFNFSILPLTSPSFITMIDKILLIVFSSKEIILSILIDDFFNSIKEEKLLKIYGVFKFDKYYNLKFKSIFLKKDKYFLISNKNGRYSTEGAIFKLNNKLFLEEYLPYGWNTEVVYQYANTTYGLLNSLYDDKHFGGLIVNNEVKTVFSDDYILKDLSVDNNYIYVCGRVIIKEKNTTFNRGVVLILDKKTYKTIDIIYTKGVGVLNGILLDNDCLKIPFSCSSTEILDVLTYYTLENKVITINAAKLSDR